MLYEMITIVLLGVDNNEDDEEEEEEEEVFDVPPPPLAKPRILRLSKTSAGIATFFVEIIVTFFSSNPATHLISSSFQFKHTALGEMINSGHFSLK